MRTVSTILLWCLLCGATTQAQLLRKATPPAPDYSLPSCWGAHPDQHDYADSIPAFCANEQRDDRVDVFFLHPTSFVKGDGWNADINDADLNHKTDAGTLLYQASVFNGSCRVYAPRYRQAHLKAFFFPNTAAARDAFDTAYADLANAFRYYLEHWNHGRPIIIASHSQGSKHAIRLLQEFFDGKPLQRQLVCAYVIGYQIEKDALQHIPAGATPTATGCILGWRSFKKEVATRRVKREAGNSICVNPISWTADTKWAGTAQHKGAIGKDFNVLLPHCVSADIAPEQQVLWVGLPEALEEKLGGLKNYHVLDYNLFYMDIRENVKARINAWFKAK